MSDAIFQLSPAERALGLAIAADESLAIPAAEEFVAILGEETALAFAKEHEVASHVAHALQLSSTPDKYSAHWANEHAAWCCRLSDYLSELDRVAAAMASQDIPLVALKNAGIARALHACPGCNPMGDIDALVSKSDFQRAHQLMLELGYQFEFRSPLQQNTLAAAELSGGGEYRTKLSSGEHLWFELQWRPVAGRWIQPEQEPNADDLISRSRPIPGSKARLMSPEDNLLQVALHTAKHSYVRAPGFRLHTDVDRIVRRESIDWDRFIRLVDELKVRTATFYSLEIPRQICATPVPEEVCQRLTPGRYKLCTTSRQLRRAGLFHPLQKKFSRLGYVRFSSLLYDDAAALWRAILPHSRSMQARYGDHRRWKLPWLHIRRIADLLFRRLST